MYYLGEVEAFDKVDGRVYEDKCLLYASSYEEAMKKVIEDYRGYRVDKVILEAAFNSDIIDIQTDAQMAILRDLAEDTIW